MYVVCFVTSMLLFAGVLFCVCSIHDKRKRAADERKRAAFEERFPPITDAEFLARCAPGANPDVALRVRRIVANQLGIEYDRVYPSSRLVEDLGAD